MEILSKQTKSSLAFLTWLYISVILTNNHVPRAQIFVVIIELASLALFVFLYDCQTIRLSYKIDVDVTDRSIHAPSEGLCIRYELFAY